MGKWMYRSTILTSALVGGEWSASRPGRFAPGEITRGTHCIGDWVVSRADLDDVENGKFLTLTELELCPLSRPARSQSLHRLRCPGCYCFVGCNTIQSDRISRLFGESVGKYLPSNTALQPRRPHALTS
jgi:hypothetical protein